MKVLSDILHKAGILQETPNVYSSGGYDILVRNSTSGRLETTSSILPSQSGNAGKFLTTNGSVASWATVPQDVNIYNSNGTLTGNRLVTQNGYTLRFDTKIIVGEEMTISDGGDYYSIYMSADGNHTGSGYSNVGIGYGVDTYQGDSNIGIGEYALGSNLTGDENIGIGHWALEDLTTGLNNIAIGGYYSGKVGGGITTGSYNTIIGAVTGLSGSLSNNIIIADGQGNIRFRDDSAQTILSRLAGVGTRMVTAGANGELSTQALPTSTNIYNSDGTLTGNRTINTNGNSLSFTNNGVINFGRSVTINSTINPWSSAFSVLQLGARTALNNSDINFTELRNNAYFDGSFNRYIATGASSSILFGGGYIELTTFPSGTAGNIISSFNVGIRVHNTGNVSIKNSTDAGYAIDVNGTSRLNGVTTIGTINAATTDTDKFLVSDSGVVKFRTGAEVLSDIGGQAALTNPITGSAASGQVAYFTGATTQAGSNNLFWDSVNNRLGIGTNLPVTNLEITTSDTPTFRVASTGAAASNAGRAAFTIARIASALETGWQFLKDANDHFLFRSISSGSTTSRMALFTTGNLLIQSGGTFTDGGQRLQVQGDAFIKGSGNTSGTTGLLVQNSDGNIILRGRNDGLITIGAGGDIGLTTNTFGSYSPTADVFGFAPRSTWATSGIGYWFLDRGATSTSGNLIQTRFAPLSTGAGFAPTSGTATYVHVAIQTTINQTGGANGITRGLYVNPTLTAAADWRSIEWSNNTGWGLYGAGTANNYIAGALGIGSTTLNEYSLRVGKSITSGSGNYFAITSDGIIDSGMTGTVQYFRTNSSQAASGSLTAIIHYTATQGTLSGTVTNQNGFFVSSTLTGATNNFGFRGQIASGSNRWNIYMDGTASNYLEGDTAIGTTTLGTATKLTIGGSETASSAIARGTLINTTLTAAANNDVLVGLDVNPTFTNGAFTGVTNAAIRVTRSTNSSLIGFGIIDATNTVFDIVYPISGGTRFGAVGSDGAMFQAYGGTNALFAGQMYFDYGSTSRIIGTRKAIWRSCTTGAAVEVMTLFSTGNMLLQSGGTHTDAGFRLDVNGTARVQGDTTITGVLLETVTTNRQTASYTLALSDRGKLVEMNVATANNLTVPLNSSVAFPIGTKIDIIQYGAGQTTVVATGGVTINSANGWLKINARYGAATLVKIGTDEWYLFGNLNA